MTGFLRSSRWLGAHRHGAAGADLAGRLKYGRNVWCEINHAIGAGTHYHNPIRQHFNVLLKFQIAVERYKYIAHAMCAAQ